MALKSKKVGTTFLGASKFYCALLSAAKHMQDDPTFLLKRGYHVFPFSAAVIACHSRWIKCHESVVAPLFDFTDDDDKAFCLTILKAYGAAIQDQLERNSADYLGGEGVEKDGQFYDVRDSLKAKKADLVMGLAVEGLTPTTAKKLQSKIDTIDLQVEQYELLVKKTANTGTIDDRMKGMHLLLLCLLLILLVCCLLLLVQVILQFWITS